MTGGELGNAPVPQLGRAVAHFDHPAVREVTVAAEPNDRLRRARERVESPNATGEPLSRQELGELVDAWVYENTDPPRVIATDANYVGQLERGRIRWPQDPDRRAGFRAVLGVTNDAELGFRRPRRSRSTVADVDRQQFLRSTLGVTVAGPLAFADLIGPTQPTPVPSVVGHTEIAEVRRAAQAFSEWDYRYGGGLLRDAAIAHLRYCVELLNARCSDQVRTDLFSTVGFFAHTAGFMAFGAGVQEDARRMFRFALNCAEESRDWHLRAKALSSMGKQTIRYGDPDTALTSIELAMVRAERLTHTERATLHTLRAHTLAKLGQVQDAARAVSLADEEFSHARPTDDPAASVRHYDAARHAGETGRALWNVAIHHGHFVAEARNRLSTAVTGFGDGFARPRVIDQIKLASLVMVKGDLTEAAVIGGQALAAAGTLRSERLADDIRDLRRFAQPHERVTGVADLLHHISSTALT
jgi:hypothetical protein